MQHPLPGEIGFRGQTEYSAYDSSYRLLEEARKSWDHVFSNEVVYSLDSIKVAINPHVGISKDYFESNIWMELHLVFETERETHYACIVEFDKWYETLRQPKIQNLSVSRDSPVLIDIAHLVQTPKQMTSDSWGIPSVIWLKRFNDGDCFCGNTFHIQPKLPRVSSVENRELGIFGVTRGQFSQTPHELIQGGSEAVEDIPDNEGNPVGRIRNGDPDAIPLAFKIILTQEGIRFRFVEGLELVPQSLKVFLRPSCLEIGISQTHRDPTLT